MGETLAWVAFIGLIVFRLARLTVEEAGPGHVFERVRAHFGIEDFPSGGGRIIPSGFFPELLSCVWCISVWYGVVLAIVFVPGDLLLRIGAGLAASAVAGMLNDWVEWLQR